MRVSLVRCFGRATSGVRVSLAPLVPVLDVALSKVRPKREPEVEKNS